MPRLSPLRIFGGSQGGGAVENGNAGRIPFGEISVLESSTTPGGSRGNRAQEQQAFHPLAEKEKNVASIVAAKPKPLSMKNQLGPRDEDARSDAATDVQAESGTPSRRQYNSVGKHGGGSQLSTPRAARIDNKYLHLHSEPGSNAGAGSAKKSVSRALRFNPELSARPAQGSSAVKSLAFCQGKHGETLTPAVVQQFELEEDLSFWQDHNVQVLIRVRPPASLEGHGRCLRQDSAHTLTWTGHPESRFTFDHVACESIDQEKLFRVAGLPMVESCISGYNNCIFAYGQTGSGKTHTMLGDIGPEQREGRGMIPRAFECLFGKIQQEEEARSYQGLKFACKCSFLEIYNEQISDLLEPSSTNLQLREDIKKGVYVESLKEVEVHGVEDVMELLNQGSANRKVAATNMNRESSRSHSVFTCVVESKWESDDSVTSTRFGRLNLVDLAGSERQKSSGAEGDRLKEAANINKSLSTLGLVIMVLVDAANGKSRHVPYRDSKLTFLLQDSLGGNSKTMIIATVSPSSSCSLETLSTLKFAQRAKFIRNNAIINEDTYGDVVSLRQQIQQLKDEVDYLRNHEHKKPVDSEQSAEATDRLAQEILAASLRREAAAESVVKNLGVEMSHLKRLVRQREEDIQQVKMVLRLRENKIRRIEAVANGSMSIDTFAYEDRQALLDEIKVLVNRVEHNPEVTRFAMENIRLMEDLKRFQAFYDHGEREAMSMDLSNLRDQIIEILDANSSLKSCLIGKNRSYESLEKRNDELVRENREMQKSLAALVKENENSRQALELEKEKIQSLEMAKCTAPHPLLQQCEERKEDSRLSLQLKEAKAEIENLEAKLKSASELQEQMEGQQLILLNELEAALLKQEDVEVGDSTAVLRSQLQSLQLELQRKEELRCLEQQCHSMSKIERSRMQQELLRIRAECEDAHELNRLFYRERMNRMPLEKHMEACRKEVEAETTDSTLQRENSRLASYCEEMMTERDVHSQEIQKRCQRAANNLVSYLSQGDDTLDAAATEMRAILQGLPMDSSSCKLATKRKVIEALQSKLHQAFAVVKDAECKMRDLSEATSKVSMVYDGQKKDTPSAVEAANRAERVSTRLLCSEKHLRSYEKATAVAFITINNLADAQVRLRARHKMERKEDEDTIGVLKARLMLREKGQSAAWLVVQHCAAVKEELRGGLDEANSVISEQLKTISDLHERGSTDRRLLQETQADLQDLREELSSFKSKSANDSLKFDQLQKAWLLEKEKMLLASASQAADVEGQWTSSCSLVLNNIVRLQQDVESFKFFVHEALGSLSREALATLHAFKSDVLELREFASTLKEDQAGFLSHSWTRVQELSRRLETTEFGIATAESVSKDLARRAEILEAELAQSKLTLEKALQAHASGTAEEKFKFDMLQESAEADKLRFQMALAESQEKLSSSQFKIGELMLDLQKSQSKCEAAEQDCMVAIAEISELDSKVQRLDDHMAHLEEENAAKKNDVGALTLAVDDLQSRNDALLKEIDQKDGACKVLESTIQGLIEDARIKEDDAASKADTVRQLQAVVREVHDELARSKEELLLAEKKLTWQENASETEKSALDSSIQLLEAKVLNLEALLDEKDLVIQNLTLQLHDHHVQAKMMDDTIENLEQQITIHRENAKASQADYENRLIQEVRKKEEVTKRMEVDMGVLRESLADATKRKSDALEANTQLQLKLDGLVHTEELLASVRVELSETTNSLRLMEEEVCMLRDTKGSLASENNVLTKVIQELTLERDNIQNELNEKAHLVESLDLELLELSSLMEQKASESVSAVVQELNDVLQERDKMSADLLVVTEQLEMAHSIADEREVIAAEARKVAERSKAHAEDKDEEIKVLERSVGELETIVNALENQVGIIKREAQMQRIMREDLEAEVQSLRHDIALRNGMLAVTTADDDTMLKLKEEATRLGEDCLEKEAQVQSYKKHISDLMNASTRQATQFQQRINELEACVDQAKATKAKGSSSPFKCIGKGLTQQMNLELDEELSAARQRIGELETIAAGRQREVFVLNARLAEAESMTHDVVRDLLGVKMDITNYVSKFSREHNSDCSNQKEIQRLHQQLEDYIKERESCLEEIDHRDAEIVAIRVAAEKLRVREQTLTVENEQLKGDIKILKRHHRE